MKCKCCGKEPKQILEYTILAMENGYDDVEECVRREEGTYNAHTDMFYCTRCYVKLGCPLGTA